jgi:hypothetical protein
MGDRKCEIMFSKMLKGRYPLKGVRIGGKIILKWILMK